jgi:hypothetical protein
MSSNPGQSKNKTGVFREMEPHANKLLQFKQKSTVSKIGSPQINRVRPNYQQDSTQVQEGSKTDEQNQKIPIGAIEQLIASRKSRSPTK